MYAFGPPAPSGKPFILHKNDDPKDNRIENLYWGDRQDNARDRASNKSAPNKHLSPWEVSLLKLLRPFFKGAFLEPMFEATPRQISNAVHGHAFRQVARINTDALSLPPYAEEIIQIAQSTYIDDNRQEKKYTEQEIDFLQTIKGFVLKIK